MPGSDQKINYQVRPAKSIERKMLCDLIREVQLMRADGEMRYIGLGAKYFTDFLRKRQIIPRLANNRF